MVNFLNLLDDDDDAIVDPRKIFMTLNRHKRFNFPRDIQTEVMNAWFQVRNRSDTTIKLNVGSGKTLIGLMLLKSSLNENLGPAIYVCPDNQLVGQVVDEAKLLGVDVTIDPRDPLFSACEKICITTIHRIFNGKSIFGIGPEGVRIEIGTIVVDDAHACISSISEQFRITIPNTHIVYKGIFDLVSDDLRHQSAPRFRDLRDNVPRVTLEVPFWSWQGNIEQIIDLLHNHKENDELKFTYPLLCEILPQCRCIFGGQKLEIEPMCPPTDSVHAFSQARRRIYMTASLSDDSVLVTHFGANPEMLHDPIVPISSQSMGERMVLMPQDINPDIEQSDIRNLLKKFSTRVNVVVIVPSRNATASWKQVADQILDADTVVAGIEKLRTGHVGLTVLVNRYDGIDLPNDACRVLAIFDLPEITSFRETSDMAILANSDSAFRRQMQRIEQGMGRGVRSNDDYCVVLLCGPKLTSRVKNRKGREMLTAATQIQMDLSDRLARQLGDRTLESIEEVIESCLGRDADWVTVSKKALLKTKPDLGLNLGDWAVATRLAFDHARRGDNVEAVNVLQSLETTGQDRFLKAWLTVRVAECMNPVDPAEAQKILLRAHRLNSNVLKPMAGVAYQKLEAKTGKQAAEVKQWHQSRYLEAADRIIDMKALLEDLQFDPEHTKEFESAVNGLAHAIGVNSQRPEQQYGVGPDNLWAFPDGKFLVIECKSGATSQSGVSKADLGQLEQSISWFEERYSDLVPKIPILVHPLNRPGPGATKVEGVRVISKPQIAKLKRAFEEFTRALGDANILNDVRRIGDLLSVHSFTSSAFVGTYTVPMK